MALSTYDELVKSVNDWGIRDDLNNQIPDFILIAETEMYNNELMPLKIRDMETISTLSTDGSRFLDLPDRFESMRSIRIVVDSGGEITYQTPERMVRQPYTGKPLFFTIIGDQVEFDRTPDQVYNVELQVYVRPLGLSETNQTNSVLTSYPNIYLFGALTEFFTRAQEDKQAQKYNIRFLNAIKGANKSQKKGRFGSAPSMSLECGNIV